MFSFKRNIIMKSFSLNCLLCSILFSIHTSNENSLYLLFRDNTALPAATATFVPYYYTHKTWQITFMYKKKVIKCFKWISTYIKSKKTMKYSAINKIHYKNKPFSHNRCKSHCRPIRINCCLDLVLYTAPYLLNYKLPLCILYLKDR
jgi:hypothetical protein